MILLHFLVVVLAAVSVLPVLAAIGIGLYRAWKFYPVGGLAASSGWLALAAAPFVYYAWDVASAHMKETLRAREVAGFERVPFPPDPPRTLEVHGSMTDRERLIYLDALPIDRIHQINSKPFKGQYHHVETFTIEPSCRGRFASLLEQWGLKRRNLRGEASDRGCLLVSRGAMSADGEEPAIVFLLGSKTTLKLPGNVWSGGNYEARIRSGGENRLLDYWERPFIERASNPLCLFGPARAWTAANTDWRKYRMDRLDFFARAVGLLPQRSSIQLP